MLSYSVVSGDITISVHFSESSSTIIKYFYSS